MTERRLVSQGEINAVIQGTSQVFGVEAGDLISRGGNSVVRAARNRAYRKLRDLGMTYTGIGMAMGRDYSTVIHNVQRDIDAERVGRTVLPTANVLSTASTFLEENFPGISVDDVQSRDTTKRHTVPRQVVARFLLENGASVSQIACALKRHHTTILHAVQKPADLMELQLNRWHEAQREDNGPENPLLPNEPAQSSNPENDEGVVLREALDNYLRVVGDYYSLSREEIVGDSASEYPVEARQIVAHLLVRLNGLTEKEIALLMQRKGWMIRTALHKLSLKIEKDPFFKEMIDEIANKVGKKERS